MKVAIFFGSKSDTETMKKAASVLTEFGIEYKAFILSAHRCAELLKQTIHTIENDGCEVIIAAAGLAAHLPGVIASMTVLPVIGVPLECLSADAAGRVSNGLAGVDALYSIVQMPRQIPVATVGINNAANAAYLAAEILAVKYPELRMKLIEFRRKLAEEAERNGGLGVTL
ncbi:MAG: 5-(carboxyamino)imidazole ribonucleotide mutase [Bacteroides sp.]|nr:5-(carboxyamino)imidazole ribonucleotide mutase [Prevotella sp.]MCM1408876.1 5-(carboxyamino)imidazole ribonucleotide mutase [Treponema brennaborense]MCM1470862.1 5-(carboxyamino)imidazole ribonucleotide mutase [Bacteroides sp.]